MFTHQFEKSADAASAIGKGADKVSGLVKKHWGQIREGIAEGFKRGEWDPRKAMTGLAPLSGSDNKVKAVAKNTTQIAKQYAPAVGAAAALGRATKGKDNNDNQSNQNIMMGY